jgi:predicted HD phosphohydrolase
MNARGQRFFATVPHNLTALSNSSLQMYLDRIPPIAQILERLIPGYLCENEFIKDYTIYDFLRERQYLANPFLMATPASMMQTDLPLTDDTRPTLLDCPDNMLPLRDKIQSYIHMIIDVLNNELADRMYEAGLPEQENVSERQHALQAGKIAILLRMLDGEVLEMILHDIARSTVDDAGHGHQHHCKEGDDIVAPLGLPTDYAWHHALAKHLLFEFCEPYQQLISQVSVLSLQVQKNKFAEQAKRLNMLSDEELGMKIYQLMLMRLIDDVSKVPDLLLTEKPNYLDDERLQNRLTKQMNLQLRLLNARDDFEVAIGVFEKKLNLAIEHMQRAKGYSRHPEIYGRDGKVARN